MSSQAGDVFLLGLRMYFTSAFPRMRGAFRMHGFAAPEGKCVIPYLGVRLDSIISYTSFERASLRISTEGSASFPLK